MARPPRPPLKTLSPADRFRPEIEKATADGISVSDLVLQLTFGDASKLKRDRAVPMEDIRFVGGELRYLGVTVVEGGVDASALVPRS